MEILAIDFTAEFNSPKYDYILKDQKWQPLPLYLLSSTCFWQVASAKF